MGTGMKISGSIIAATLAMAVVATPAQAIEGGTGTYLLGGRDIFMGILPPPGTYISTEYIHLSGEGPTLELGGLIVADPKIDVSLYRLGATYVFPGEFLGGSPAINLNLNYGVGELDVSGVAGRLGQFTGDLTDNSHGWADPAITPLIGWHSAPWHTSFGATVYIPVGLYETADLQTMPSPALDNALNYGKNRWGFDPTLSVTWFDPAVGWEVNGSAGVTFTTRNEATDYQTAPEFHFEGSIVKHFADGVALGVVGYAYRQLGEDSGSGADNLRASLGAESLIASVFGIGPFLSVSGNIGEVPVTLKAKYFHEFHARRRFESDVIWTALAFSF
jgi:hypothetical protein